MNASVKVHYMYLKMWAFCCASVQSTGILWWWQDICLFRWW